MASAAPLGGALGALLGPLGGLSGRLEAILGVSDTLLDRLGPSSGPPEAVLERSGSPGSVRERSGGLLGPSGSGPEALRAARGLSGRPGALPLHAIFARASPGIVVQTSVNPWKIHGWQVEASRTERRGPRDSKGCGCWCRGPEVSACPIRHPQPAQRGPQCGWSLERRRGGG